MEAMVMNGQGIISLDNSRLQDGRSRSVSGTGLLGLEDEDRRASRQGFSVEISEILKM